MRERGIWNVRISDVAKRAGLSPTSVVYYFGTKDQLLAEAIARADDAFYQEVDGLLDAVESPIDRIAWLIVRSSTSDWLLWMDLWVYTRHHPETAVAQRGFHRRWRKAIEDVIVYGNETRAWDVGAPRGVAQRISAITDGLAVHMVLGDPDHTRERYVEMTLTAASLELGCDLAALREAASRCPAEDGAP